MIDMTSFKLELEQRWEEGERIDAICRYALLPTGKLFRPRLLLESCGAVGGTIEQVIPAAIGSECGHIASLIHDDIIDGDAVRRGRESVHNRFGAGDAILSGDMLIFHLSAACRSAMTARSRHRASWPRCARRPPAGWTCAAARASKPRSAATWSAPSPRTSRSHA